VILVTTAGKVGAHAAALLARGGHETRLVVRDPDAHRGLRDAGVELVRADLDDPKSVAAALEGVSSVILVTAASLPQEASVVRAATVAGVAQVTKVTTEASADSPIARRRDHHAVEQLLAESGLAHTLLRSNAFMQNLLALAPDIATTARFASPSGDGRIGMIDARDVAEVAARIAASPAGHAGRTYRLSGPAALSYDDVAVQLGALLGTTITHDRITVAEQEAILLARGFPAAVARANAQALGLFASGDSQWTSPDAASLLGRPATSFAAFAAEHRVAFVAGPGGAATA
jgi:uncharacterized protein YbjT (DUF2867 family)